jgi:hypothetical protein
MDALRLVGRDGVSALDPCCRCRAVGCHWDRIGGQPYCPDCQEALAQGTADPLIARTEKHPCAACGQVGTLRFLTFPLGSPEPLEMDLCPGHFRALIGRRLDARTYLRLRRQLDGLRLAPQNIFLLHEAFYDDEGRSLQPALDLE